MTLPPLDLSRARALVDRLGGRRVLVVGDVMVDRFIIGTVTRISPEAPVPVVRFESEHARLGGAANVAHNLAALGAKVEVPALSEKPGETLPLKIPAGTQSGTVFRLRGKGFPTAPSATTRGDLHVRVVVETPQALADSQRALLSELMAKLPASVHPQRQRFRDHLKTIYGTEDTTVTPITKVDSEAAVTGHRPPGKPHKPGH